LIEFFSSAQSLNHQKRFPNCSVGIGVAAVPRKKVRGKPVRKKERGLLNLGGGRKVVRRSRPPRRAAKKNKWGKN